MVWNRPFKQKLVSLYDQWLESGEKSYTRFDNVRAPSKTQLVDMILESWKNITEETICKSFFCTGQAQESRPEDITCLRSGAPCAEAFDKVSEIWDKIPEKIEQLPEEIDLDEDLFDDDISDED